MRRMLDLIDFGLATPPWPEVLYICECDGDPPTSNLARLLRDFAERSPPRRDYRRDVWATALDWAGPAGTLPAGFFVWYVGLRGGRS